MAADAPTPAPAPSKSSRRLHAAGKLAALFGLPLLLIGSIFGGGLYVGGTRSYRIQTLEARYLGFPDPGGATWTPPSARSETVPEPDAAAEPEPSTSGTDTNTQANESAGEPDQPQPDQPQPDQPQPNQPQPNQPQPNQPQPNQPQPNQPQPDQLEQPGLPIVAAAPVGPELRTKFDASRVVHVKLMVDPALAATREDWLDYAAGLFQATRGSFAALFGIELRLQGIVVWNAAQGTKLDSLAGELETHEREGAELILGLVAQAEPAGYSAPTWTGDVHGDYALVFADPEREDRYYHNTLRTLALLFGAEPSTDPEAAQLGSFMSPAGSPNDAAPVLDPANRGQVIFQKQRPFVTRELLEEPAQGDDPQEM